MKIIIIIIVQKCREMQQQKSNLLRKSVTKFVDAHQKLKLKNIMISIIIIIKYLYFVSTIIESAKKNKISCPILCNAVNVVCVFFFEFECFILNLVCNGFIYVEEAFNVKLIGADCIISQRRLNEELNSMDWFDWCRFLSGLRGLTKRHRLTDKQYENVT